MTFEELSPAQKEVYALAEQGLTVSHIADKLGLSQSVVHAQITRIRKKVSLTHANYAGQRMPHTGCGNYETSTPPQLSQPPKIDQFVPKTPREIVHEAAQAGEAKYPELDAALADAANKVTGRTDVHPMILLGVTIQFIKLVGGRMTAHQLIEDIYEALRMMVGDGGLPDDGSTAPWPKDLEAENATLKNQMLALQQELVDLRRHLERSRSPEPSGAL